MNLLKTILKKSQIGESKKKLVINVYWAMLGKIVNIICGLFVGILVARYLGPDKWGLMNYVISFVGLFTVLANFGMDNIEIRELSKENIDKEIILGTAFRLKIYLAIITLLIITLVVYLFENDILTQVMIIVYSLSIVFSTLNVIRNYFTSIVLNKYIVKTEIMRNIIGTLIKIVLLFFHAPLFLFIIASAFDFLLIAIGYFYSYKKKVGDIFLWSYDHAVAKYLLKQSFPLVLSGAAVIIYQRIDQVMIGNMLNNESVGYFSTAVKFTELIVFLPLIISQTVTPMLVRAKEKNWDEYNRKGLQFVSITVWIAIFLAIAVSTLSYPMIALTFGEKYLSAVPVLQIMAFKAVGMGLSSSVGQMIIIEKTHKWAFVRNLLACALCVGLNWLIIPRYGMIGSAWVTIITVMFAGCFANILILPYHRYLKIQLQALFWGWKYLFKIKKIME